jgi:membrane-associated phospholipid phosphatase
MRLALAIALTVAPAAPVLANPVQEADIGLLRAINGAHSPSGDVAYRILSNDVQLLATPLVATWAVSQGPMSWEWGPVLRTAESEVVAGVLAAGVKLAIHRPRPYVTHPDLRLPLGPERLDSFPSGHAAISFAGATSVAIDHPAWAVPAYAWAALVCYSRMYNGVHYPTDVLGGAALGVGSAFLAHWAFSGLNAYVYDATVGHRALTQATVAPLTWSTTF